MAEALDGITGEIERVDNLTAIDSMCAKDFNLRSKCFMVVVFESVDPDNLLLVRNASGVALD